MKQNKMEVIDIIKSLPSFNLSQLAEIIFIIFFSQRGKPEEFPSFLPCRDLPVKV